MKKILQPSNISASLFQLSLPVAVYLAIISGAGIGWWLLSIFCFAFVYTITGNNIGFHRYFAHKQFKVNKFVEDIFLWCGSMVGFGGPLSYSMTHLIHHKYPDSALDPHGPTRGLRSILVIFQKTVNPKETPLFSRRMIELNNSYSWVHKYYNLLLLANALILFLIDYKLFLFFWWLPACLSNWYIAWAVIRQHWNMSPHNSRFNRWEFTHESLHKNHHDSPGRSNDAVNPGEIDWTYRFSKIFFPKYN